MLFRRYNSLRLSDSKLYWLFSLGTCASQLRSTLLFLTEVHDGWHTVANTLHTCRIICSAIHSWTTLCHWSSGWSCCLSRFIRRILGPWLMCCRLSLLTITAIALWYWCFCKPIVSSGRKDTTLLTDSNATRGWSTSRVKRCVTICVRAATDRNRRIHIVVNLRGHLAPFVVANWYSRRCWGF